MSMPTTVNEDTRPNPALEAEPSAAAHPRPAARRGCLWLLLGGVFMALLPVFLSGLYILLYLLFPPPALNVLVLGLDARAGEGFVTRTDSVMVMGVQPARLDVSLLSIPRDLFIETPGYGLQRINTVNVLGEQDQPGSGARLAAQAVAQSFHIPVDRYLRVNFDGFIALVDALGGIDVEVPSLLIDYAYPTDDFGTTTVQFEPGWQHMDGWQALAYARTRHADDDYRRAARQQQLMVALAQAVVRPGNWPRLPAAAAAFFQSVDTDLTPLDLLALAPTLVLDGAVGSIDRLVIDRDLIQRSPEGYAIPNYAALDGWLSTNLR
ncbi:MAG: LCP family protein [Anaerolineae bacterium]|nr:LCP family protein [Anaerolineae bacterium]